MPPVYLINNMIFKYYTPRTCPYMNLFFNNYTIHYSNSHYGQ